MSKLKVTDSINKYTYGGVGAHWKGCNEMHWDCQIRTLQKRVDELTAEIDRVAIFLAIHGVDGYKIVEEK